MADYLDLVRSIDRENVGGTIDTGHMKFYRADLAVEGADRLIPAGVRRYNDLIVEFITGLGPKLFHLHVDDVRAVDWREHFVPGTGILDWPRIFRELSALRYQGLLVAEILYYDGAHDTGLAQMRVFTQRTRDGAPAEGLLATRALFEKIMAAPPPRGAITAPAHPPR
jgi:sugar phosphate isomerase/epimerase